ncbi:HpsJ family protein [Chamaesiphon sp. VAR_48_metabat_403]|uniref:HpsJ family protein n=1 Tax=Chamaesiphon sp. VAR_48_metabat_403 TaxID=2964700 RepID=UPI00286EAD12|nr:HpsJ family protein [Chamaesiphon sp. VAR_48_metabat_403]
MQPTVSSFLTPLALKTAGAVLILSSLIDLIFMLWLPPENLVLEGNRWWLYATSQLVDRGLLPLVGIAFVVAGDWIAIVSTEDGGERGNTWRIGTFSLASLLGLIFILIIPFQVITTNDFKAQDLTKISEEATQIKQGIEGNLQQINALSKDKVKEQIAAIDKEIASGQAQGERLANLQLNKLLLTDPKKFAQKSDQNLQVQRQKREAQVNTRMLQTGVRTSLASFLLAIAYITIGWTGLRRVLR